MRIIDSISEKGDGLVNEDIFDFCNNRCWVLDGVTSKTDKYFYSSVSDAQFIVNEFSTILKKCCNEDDVRSNADALTAAMDVLRSNLSKSAFDVNEKLLQPSFTLAIMHILESLIQINILSDCYVIVKESGITRVYTDKRINCIVKKTNQVKEYIHNNAIDENLAKSLLLEQKVKNRELMNTRNGYWVGTLDGSAFNNTLSVTLNRDTVEQIILCSDGFYKVFQAELIYYDDLFSGRYSFYNSLVKLRDFEKRHLEVDTKKSDDATAIRIVI